MARFTSNRSLLVIIGILAILAFLTRDSYFGMTRTADGWWGADVHAVDGYWVTEERPCPASDAETCAAAVEEATDVLLEREPAANVTRAAIAGYPTSKGDDPSEVTINLGGLAKPQFVILDLADATRRTVALTCGPHTSTQDGIMRVVCWESDFDIWRVSGS